VAARVVLLKGLTDRGFVFYTNYESRKGEELAADPTAALVFNWLELQRQVRIEGRVERLPAEQSTTYFQSRPRGSQLGAWSSPQSKKIPGRDVLEQRYQQMEERFAGQDPLPRPAHWGGYVVLPQRIEFWQGRSSRLHDRIEYQLQDDGQWTRVRLAP
jgi:pyridoxamine 5'-phosphate oxidase